MKRARSRAAEQLGARAESRLQPLLLEWYRSARRDLPWRRTRDPYAVWISEAMLQQTRVEVVLPYYRRFLERYPTMAELAGASEGEVLSLWSGLGYYTRARKLLLAAREMVERHAGRFPRAREAALALPGVGPYTAGAVLSIAYGLREPVVDGNVVRVLCRLFALEGDPAALPLRRELWERAAALLPRDGTAGDWNQALMELGATVCTPRAPRCGECPVQALCMARMDGRVGELPQLRARRTSIDVALAILLIERGGAWLLARRAPTGRMAGLLEFPTREIAPPGGQSSGLFPPTWSRSLTAGPPVGELSHSITHHRIRAEVRAGRAAFANERQGFLWRSAEELALLELSGLARKILRAGLLDAAASAWNGRLASP